MYCTTNFKTKRELKAAVAAGKVETIYQPNDIFGITEKIANGQIKRCSVEGPHFPEPHTWYADVDVEQGRITKVR